MHEYQDIATTEAPVDDRERTPAANDSDAQPETLAFTFSGSGQEYFRIWIVNLFLTVATLGIYSAWAKVRRLQYFDRNTQLASAVFDFRGDPVAILKGRVLAVCLFGAYHYAYGFSLTIGLAIVATLLLALSFFMRGALRFRLHHTWYRGLRFGFSGSVGGAYRAYLPPVLTFLLPGALAALDPTGKSSLFALAMYLGWPLMYGAMKRYQNGHLRFGAAGSAYDLAPRRFVKPYLISMLLVLAGLALMFALLFLSIAVMKNGAPNPRGAAQWLMPILSGALTAYVLYLLVGPYLQARFANLVWSNTRFPGVEMRSTMQAWPLLKLQAANVLLTLLTLGLYRPFAVVSVYRYRLEHLAVHTAGSFEQVVAASVRQRSSAAGDGVADFLSIDLSW